MIVQAFSGRTGMIMEAQLEQSQEGLQGSGEAVTKKSKGRNCERNSFKLRVRQGRPKPQKPEPQPEAEGS